MKYESSWTQPGEGFLKEYTKPVPTVTKGNVFKVLGFTDEESAVLDMKVLKGYQNEIRK
jgi:hypothetical protein